MRKLVVLPVLLLVVVCLSPTPSDASCFGTGPVIVGDPDNPRGDPGERPPIGGEPTTGPTPPLTPPERPATPDLPGGPPTGGGAKAPAPGTPTPGLSAGRGPTSGGLSRPGGARPRGAFGLAGSWSVWWEMNREHLIGIRNAAREPVSGGTDPMPAHREKVRAVLRRAAQAASHEKTRAAALVALGRAGDERDVPLLIAILRGSGPYDQLAQGALIALAELPPARDAKVREAVRCAFDDVLTRRIHLRSGTRQLGILALGIRARKDPGLVRLLGARCTGRFDTVNEAAALLFACGLSRDEFLAPLVLRAAETGEFGGKALHDVSRSHAVLGLPFGAGGVPVLARILTSTRTPEITRRSAAIALGKIMREAEVDAAGETLAGEALLAAFRGDRDALVRGYAALAMGGAGKPFGTSELLRAVSRGRCAVVRPCSVIALGLAHPRLEEREAAKVRALLLGTLAKTRDPDLTAALLTAVGLSGASEGRMALLARAGDAEKNPEIRAPACEALGLLGGYDPGIEETLIAALGGSSDLVAEKAAIALGLIGSKPAVRLLVTKLVSSPSERLQAHLVIALSHIGGTAAIEPLREVLRDPSKKHTIRESAASALGILVGRPELDPLFEIDAALNPYGLTVASAALARVY